MLRRFKKWLVERRSIPEGGRQSPRRLGARDTDALQSKRPEDPEKALVSRKMSGGRAGNAPQKENRHGIRILSLGDDLERLFSTSQTDVQDTDTERQGEIAPQRIRKASAARSRKKGRKQKASTASNRHGIPLLDSSTDLDRLFGEADVSAPAPGEGFGDLLEASLSNENSRTILQKKQEGATKSKPVSMRRRLKQYPPPQRELDLHGFRSHPAEQRTESFVRTAFMGGDLTLRIIVGKGLHSENGPVLPDIVENRLHQLKREGIVLSYRWEGRSKKRSGALIVYLDPLRVVDRV